MGALWSDSEGAAPAGGKVSFLAALTRAVDLRRFRPYHAPARPEPRAPMVAKAAGRLTRIGVWVPEEQSMRQVTRARFSERLRFLLHTDDPPPRAALAFALGVFIGWTPFIGFHFLIALGLAFLLGLNRLAVFAGTFVNNPWTFVPMYTGSAYLGSWLLGSEINLPRLHGSSWAHFGEFFEQCRPWIIPLTTGSIILGFVCAALSFPVVLCAIRWYRGLRHAG